MKRSTILGMLLGIALAAPHASADLIDPSAVMTSQFNGTDYDYTITLTNLSSSTGDIGTFWYAWVPGEDFLPTSPIAGGFVTPAGWTEHVTHAGPNDGFAIQWVAGSAGDRISPGESLTFGFESADSPSVLAGDSPFFPGTPIGTSFVYPGAPFSDPGHEFIVDSISVPVPPTFLMGIIGGVTVFSASKLRRLRRA